MSAEPVSPRIEFPLSADNSISIILRRRATKEEFAFIKKLIDLAEVALVARDEAALKPKPA